LKDQIKRRIAILGSTGSVGTQALEVIEHHPDNFQVEVLTALNNADLLIEQACKYKPNAVVIGNEDSYKKVSEALQKSHIKVYAGENALSSILEMDSIDLVLTALVGYSGLKPTIKAIECGKQIALANKETLVIADNLPAIKIGSSRNLQVGAWVLAVGNPFNLTSTVTAGIVSAKGRNINILKGKFPIESFIQTDAAINPGNSGGALVNKEGELVGINTAILSRTGSYAGYGFAVPVDIVKKVVRDIIEYGEVQKAFFGGEIADLDEDIVNRLGIKVGTNFKGVILNYVHPDGSAAKADLQEGDIIIKINNEEVNSKSAFNEIIGYYSPGDQITVTYQHKGKVMNSILILTNREGTTGIIKTEIFTSKSLGADLEVVPKVERDLLEIDHGVRINKVYRGLINELGIREGFIITSINSYPIKDPEDLIKVIERVRGRVRIEGVSKEGVKGYYSFYLR